MLHRRHLYLRGHPVHVMKQTTEAVYVSFETLPVSCFWTASCGIGQMEMQTSVSLPHFLSRSSDTVIERTLIHLPFFQCSCRLSFVLDHLCCDLYCSSRFPLCWLLHSLLPHQYRFMKRLTGTWSVQPFVSLELVCHRQELLPDCH